MAKAVFKEKTVVNWDKYMEHYDNIRWDIERTIPGFDHYNDRSKLPGGFYLPNSARDGVFKTKTGKANFTVAKVTPIVIEKDELIMMTIRSHDQFNTTIYGLDDRYRGIHNERRVIFMNQNDIKKLGYKAGDKVDLFNHHNGVERVARNFIIIEFSIPEGCSATYFPETNVLVPIDSVADRSNTPTSKMIILKLKPHKVA
jgi:anaerobic selenocysteine-containing dehydrogenase